MKIHHKHKKRSLRFIIFFVLLVIYSVLEDFIALSVTGVGIDFLLKPKHLFLIICIAVVFTVISEITEELYMIEKPKIDRIIKRRERK